MVLEKQYSLKVKNRLWSQLDLSVKWGWLANFVTWSNQFSHLMCYLAIAK